LDFDINLRTCFFLILFSILSIPVFLLTSSFYVLTVPCDSKKIPLPSAVCCFWALHVRDSRGPVFSTVKLNWLDQRFVELYFHFGLLAHISSSRVQSTESRTCFAQSCPNLPSSSTSGCSSRHSSYFKLACV